MRLGSPAGRGSAVALACACIVTITTPSAPRAQTRPDKSDVIFATVDGKPLALDLYMPAKAAPYLIVWVHGGAWTSGTKANTPSDLAAWLQSGYAVASVDFRQSTEAQFPARSA